MHCHNRPPTLLALLLLAAALTSGGVARADGSLDGDPAAPTHWAFSLGATGTLVRVAHPAMDDTFGRGAGLRADVAYFPLEQLGLAAEAWMLWSKPGDCPADGSCYNFLADEQRFFTAGPRWRPRPSLYLQATGGVALSYQFEYGEQSWSGPAATLSGGWGYLLGGIRFGVEARTSRMWSQGATLTSGGIGLSVGAAW